MWSSVLGSSLTSISPGGAKQETKVFAGAIAKQTRYVENNQNFDAVEWTTADPVAGTVGKLGYYNGAAQLFREETEPLGQKIDGWDRSGEEPPTASEPNAIGRAGDPHWQCLAGTDFYGSFSGMPFHCQKKMLQDLDYGLVELYGFSQREENPMKVEELTDSPLPDFTAPYSASDEMMSYALTSRISCEAMVAVNQETKNQIR